MPDPSYCGHLSYKFFTYDTSTSSFILYTGSQISDGANLDIYIDTSVKGANTFFVAAVSYGNTAQDYVRIGVTVCGLETLTTDGNQVSYLFYKDTAYNDAAAIDWIDISTWFTYDATGSDPNCRSQDLTHL